MTDPRYDLAALTTFTRELFTAAGLAPDLAAPVGTYLVKADAMGHDTHGLALAPWYLDHIANGIVTCSGRPDVVSDRGAAICWNGRRLPGAYLVDEAMTTAIERAREFGTCTLSIGDAHHAGAMAVYLERATDLGLMATIASSSPSGAQVAPFGGLTGVYNPQPIAYGIPTDGDPVLIDISAGITTANMAKRLIAEGRAYERDWLMDAEGRTTNDPNAMNEGGTLLPVGGLDHGQKGYGLSLSIEALTQGLAGYGRADTPKGTSSAITVQIHDPEAFGGRDAFIRQTGWLAATCRAVKPHPDFGAVRLPGEAALKRKRTAEREGVRLHPGIMEGLAECASCYGLHTPAPVSG